MVKPFLYNTKSFYFTYVQMFYKMSLYLKVIKNYECDRKNAYEVTITTLGNDLLRF